MADVYLLLVDDLDPRDDAVADHMFAGGYLTLDELDDIHHSRTRKKSATTFLTALARNHSPKQFDAFVDALRNAHYGFLVKKLLFAKDSE